MYRTDRTVSELRQELEEASAAWPVAEGTSVTRVTAGGVGCAWVTVATSGRERRPAPPAPLGEPGEPGASVGPVYFHVHGGGFYRGSSRVALPLCSHVCAGAAVPCVSVDYRLSPEHPFPAALDDVAAAYKWLVVTCGVSPGRVACGGDSAGGALVLGLALRLRDEAPGLLPACLVGFSPWVDLAQGGASFLANADAGVPNCPKPYLDHWAAVYLASRSPTDPLASPLHAASLGGLPPLLVQVGGSETMLDMSVSLVSRVARDGGDSALEVYRGQGHVFQNDVRGSAPAAGCAVASAARFVRCHVGGDAAGAVGPLSRL